MKGKKVNFTVDSIKKMTCEAGNKRSIFYDKKQPGLALLVSSRGIKTFALHAYDRTRKKAIQHTISRYPDINIEQARDTANKLLFQLANGVDIKSAARAIREEPTLDKIFEKWLSNAKLKKRTWENDERLYHLHIQPSFGIKRISSITPQLVRTWHAKLPKKYRQRKSNGEKAKLSRATANRCLALLKTIYNQEADHIPNPCNNAKMFAEEPRDRFLSPTELKKFFLALEDSKTPPSLQDLIYLLLFTGGRRSNVLSMTWREIDLDSAIWTIPPKKSKSGKRMTIPLVDEAVNILKRRKKESSSIYVFPGSGKRGHLVEPKRAWTSLLQRAELENVRLHDLRRTCGSYQAASGSNQAVISKSLGHQNIATTSRYTQFNLDPVRESMQRAANAMIRTKESTDKVLGINNEHE
jgi:integrase